MTFSFKTTDSFDVVCYEALKNGLESSDLVQLIEDTVISSWTEEQKNDCCVSPTFKSYKITDINSICQISPNIWPIFKSEMDALIQNMYISILTMMAMNGNQDYLKIRPMVLQNNLTWIDDGETNQESNITAIADDKVFEFSKSRSNQKDDFTPSVKVHTKN